MKLSELRKDYSLKSLEMHEVSSDPLKQFNQWMDEALAAEVLEAIDLQHIRIDIYTTSF
jgi:pyridoxamine 5'-phosphate oxidase